MYGHGLPKQGRLLRRFEFINLSKKGNSAGNRLFVAAFQYNQLQRSRLGVTVTKKVGNAVERNRIKRLVREYFRRNRCMLAGGVDLNVIAKKACSEATNQQVFSALRHLLGKIGEKKN